MAGKAAIGHHGVTGDKRRLVAGKKGHHVGNLPRAAQCRCEVLVQQNLLDFLGHAFLRVTLSTKPMTTAFERMPCLPYCAATMRLKASRAALEQA